MTLALELREFEAELEQRILTAWREAHGGDVGKISTSWGNDRIIVMIEDVLFKGEQALAQSAKGQLILEEYLTELLNVVLDEEAKTLSQLLDNRIVSTSIRAHSVESWVMLIFRLDAP